MERKNLRPDTYGACLFQVATRKIFGAVLAASTAVCFCRLGRLKNVSWNSGGYVERTYSLSPIFGPMRTVGGVRHSQTQTGCFDKAIRLRLRTTNILRRHPGGIIDGILRRTRNERDYTWISGIHADL